jgi:hypothetical protein
MVGTKGQQDLSLGSLGPSRAELTLDSLVYQPFQPRRCAR